MWRSRGAAERCTVSQQQLLLSGKTRPTDVLAVGVVEPKEGQDGLSQPQSRHTPQRCLRTQGVIVDRKKTSKWAEELLCVCVWRAAVMCNHKHTHLCQIELCVERWCVHVQVKWNRLRLCTTKQTNKQKKHEENDEYNFLYRSSFKGHLDQFVWSSARTAPKSLSPTLFTCMSVCCHQSQCRTMTPDPETRWHWRLQTGRAHTHSAAQSGRMKTGCWAETHTTDIRHTLQTFSLSHVFRLCVWTDNGYHLSICSESFIKTIIIIMITEECPEQLNF